MACGLSVEFSSHILVAFYKFQPGSIVSKSSSSFSAPKEEETKKKLRTKNENSNHDSKASNGQTTNHDRTVDSDMIEGGKKCGKNSEKWEEVECINENRFRTESAIFALESAGSSIFSGIILTLGIGLIILAFSKSNIFSIYYFRMYLGIGILGSIHGLIVLPTLLSLFGRINRSRICINGSRTCINGSRTCINESRTFTIQEADQESDNVDGSEAVVLNGSSSNVKSDSAKVRSQSIKSIKNGEVEEMEELLNIKSNDEKSGETSIKMSSFNIDSD